MNEKREIKKRKRSERGEEEKHVHLRIFKNNNNKVQTKQKKMHEKKKSIFNTAKVRTIHICFKRTKPNLFINTTLGNSDEIGTSTLSLLNNDFLMGIRKTK